MVLVLLLAMTEQRFLGVLNKEKFEKEFFFFWLVHTAGGARGVRLLRGTRAVIVAL